MNHRVYLFYLKLVLIAYLNVSCLLSISRIEAQTFTDFLDYLPNNQSISLNVDKMPTGLTLGKSAADDIWYFVDLLSPNTGAYVFESSNKGTYSFQFPSADEVFQLENGVEIYFNNSNGKRLQIGKAIPMSMDINETLIVRNVNPSAPKSRNVFRDNYSKLSNNNWTLQLNDQQLQRFDLYYLKDVQVSVQEVITDERDGDGVLYLPQSSSEVVRIKRIIKRSYQIIDKEGEQVENTIIKANSPLSVLLIPEEHEYLYFDKSSNQLVASVITDNRGKANKVYYYSTSTASHPSIENESEPHFILYPNLSFGDDIRLDFHNYDAGTYSLVIYNVIGRKIWSENFTITHNITIQENLSFLAKGTYIYSLYSENGQKLLTRRLAILKP